MAMDIFGLRDDKNKANTGRRSRLIFIFVIVVAALSLSIYGSVYGFNSAKIFLNKTAAVFRQSFYDMLGSGNRGKLAAEINLVGGAQNQVRGISQASPGVTVAEKKTFTPAALGNKKNKSTESPASSSNQASSPATSKNNSSTKIASVSTKTVATSAKVSKENPVPICSFATESGPTHNLLINEIAWMGSSPKQGETVMQATENEWLELKNNSTENINLLGSQILNASGKFKIVFDYSEKLSAAGLYLLERTDDNSVPGIAADKIYSGALANSGEWLKVFGSKCEFLDEINASSGWPGGSNDTKQTLERDALDFGWHTSAVAGGTPKAENSRVLAPQHQALSTQTTSSTTFYSVGVSLGGDGSGTVTSNPPGISCGFDCARTYSEGTELILIATSTSNSSFAGWSGTCGGTTNICTLVVSSTLSITAIFKLIAPVPSAQTPPASPAPTSTTTPNHLVVSNIQVVGAATTNDFVKIFNPTNSAVDIGGWKLRKKTKPGTEYSIRVFSPGSSIAPQGYFTWANSLDGFSETFGANASSTETLAADNSIALIDISGTLIDAVAWGSGQTNPYVEGSPYPSNPAANQVLSRKIFGGAIQDSDNNSEDFEIR